MAKKDQEEPQDVSAETMTAGVQEQVDQEQEQGYVGTKVDPTPNDAYTVAGVTSGAETPETQAVQTGAFVRTRTGDQPLEEGGAGGGK